MDLTRREANPSSHLGRTEGPSVAGRDERPDSIEVGSNVSRSGLDGPPHFSRLKGSMDLTLVNRTGPRDLT